MRMVHQAAAAAAQVSSRSTAAAAGRLDGSQALPGPGQIYHQSHPRQRDCGAQVSQEDLEADAVRMAELERWQYEVILVTPWSKTHIA